MSFTLDTIALLQSIASEDIGRQVLTYGERYESFAMLVHKSICCYIFVLCPRKNIVFARLSHALMLDDFWVPNKSKHIQETERRPVC